jgi:hypothetical protein
MGAGKAPLLLLVPLISLLLPLLLLLLLPCPVHPEIHNPSPLLMALHTKDQKRNPPGIMTVEMCKQCSDPSREGSHINAFNAFQGPDSYEVMAEIVYALPNDGKKKIINKRQVRGRIALFDRGGVPLIEKVLLAQDAGAIAVVLVDDGQCVDEDFSFCGMAGRLSDGGYARHDRHDLWKKVTVPSVLVTEIVGQRIKNLMHLEVVEIPRMGEHWKTMEQKEDEL